MESSNGQLTRFATLTNLVKCIQTELICDVVTDKVPNCDLEKVQVKNSSSSDTIVVDLPRRFQYWRKRTRKQSKIALVILDVQSIHFIKEILYVENHHTWITIS